MQILDSLNGQQIVLDVLAEDGKRVLSSSDPVTLKPNFIFQSDGLHVVRQP